MKTGFARIHRLTEKKIFYLLFPACFSVFFIFSCKQKTDYTKEISCLDSTEIALQKAEKFLFSLDTNFFRSSYESASGHLLTIKEKISRDTIKKQTALIVSTAYEQSGNILTLLDNKKYFERAIAESKQRLNDLEHDLNKNLIEKNKSMEYVVYELNASQKILDAINLAVEKAKTSAAKLDSMKAQIILLADSLRRNE